MNEQDMRTMKHNLVVVTQETTLKTNMGEPAWDV